MDRLAQERRNSIANAMELHLSCTKPSGWELCTPRSESNILKDPDILSGYTSPWCQDPPGNEVRMDLFSNRSCLKEYFEHLTEWRATQITKFMWPHGAHLGPVGPRWAPCWPHEPCYKGSAPICECTVWSRLTIINVVNMTGGDGLVPTGIERQNASILQMILSS